MNSEKNNSHSKFGASLHAAEQQVECENRVKHNPNNRDLRGCRQHAIQKWVNWVDW